MPVNVRSSTTPPTSKAVASERVMMAQTARQSTLLNICFYRKEELQSTLTDSYEAVIELANWRKPRAQKDVKPTRT